MSDRSRLRHRGVVVRRAQQRKAASGNASTSDEDAVDDGQAAEQLTDLIGASQPSANSFMHGKVRHVFAEEPYPPRCGGKSPVTALKSVVFPAPFEPRMARRSPAATRRLMSASATSAPNTRPTPSNSSAWALLEERRSAAWLTAMTGSIRLRTASPALAGEGWGEGRGDSDTPHPALRATFSRKSGRRDRPHLQSGLSRLATPSLRKSASGMPSVWLTALSTLITLL